MHDIGVIITKPSGGMWPSELLHQSYTSVFRPPSQKILDPPLSTMQVLENLMTYYVIIDPNLHICDPPDYLLLHTMHTGM